MLDKKIQSLIWWGWSPLILTPWSDSSISLHFMFISHFYLNGNAGSVCLFVFLIFGVSLTCWCGIADKMLKGCKSGWTWWGCIGPCKSSGWPCEVDCADPHLKMNRHRIFLIVKGCGLAIFRAGTVPVKYCWGKEAARVLRSNSS